MVPFITLLNIFITMSLPSVIGEITSGRDFLDQKTIYKMNVTCPFCKQEHTHGLGSKPTKHDRTTRCADCLKGEYMLLVNDSIANNNN